MRHTPGWMVAALLIAGRAEAQQRLAPQAALDQAIAAIDAAHVERADTLLRAVLANVPDSLRGIRARALQLLAARQWWTDQHDSARTTLQASVAADPFVVVDGDRLHADLQAAWREARRNTSILAVRVAADTTIQRPDSGALAVSVAVGRPGTLRWHLVSGVSDSIIMTGPADTVRTWSIPLRPTPNNTVEPGLYRLTLELTGAGDPIARSVALQVATLPVDTGAHQPEIPDSLFRAEDRRGSASLKSMARGFALGAAAIVVPMAMANADVGDGSMRKGALVIGGGLSLATIFGAIAGRPTVVIEENVMYNRGLRETRRERNASIAAANDRTRRFAPLRVRATVLQ